MSGRRGDPVLRGDLTVETSEALLSGLARQEATGCLVIEEPAQQGTGDAQIHFRGGKVYAAALPGGTFLVGTRLILSFGLGSEALGEALEAQRAELHGWRLGEILVHLGHVDAQAVDAISREQVLEIITETCSWRTGGWRFRAGDRTRAMLSQPIVVPEMLTAIGERQLEWRHLQKTLGSPEAGIVLSDGAARPSEPVELAALIQMVDTRGAEGFRACAHATGLSLLEGARLALGAFADGSLRQWAGLELVAGGDGTVEPEAAPSAGEPPDLTPDLAADVPVRTIRRASHALACLLALAGPDAPPAAVVEPAGEPETVATVLDLTAARAARAGEPAADDAATVSARKEAFAPAFTVADPRAAAAGDRPVRAGPLRDGSVRDGSVRDVKVLAEQVERARQTQLDAEDADALLMATALRAAAEVHAQREANAKRALPSAFTAPVPTSREPAASSPSPSTPVPAWNRPAEPAAVAAATWGQGFLSISPPKSADSGSGRDPQADTASLMRELTSLGRSDDEDARPAPRQAVFRKAARQVSAPAASAAPQKKRKGFFGR